MNEKSSQLDSGPNPPQTNLPGASGPKLTMFLLVSLVLVGTSLSYVLWSYNNIDEARAETEQSWRGLSALLADRYRDAEQSLRGAADSGKLDTATLEKFRGTADRFRTTAQQHLQYQAAVELEEILAAVDGIAGPSEALLANVESHNAQLAEQQNALSTAGGQVLSRFLNFDQPPPLNLGN